MITLKKKKDELYKSSKGTEALLQEFQDFNGSKWAFAKKIGTSNQNLCRWLDGREPNGHSKSLLEDLFGIKPALWLEH